VGGRSRPAHSGAPESISTPELAPIRSAPASSIATGIALGFIFYPLTKLLAGRVGEVKPTVWVLAVIFILRFVYLGTI